MGEWQGPDDDALLAIAYELQLDDRDHIRFIDAMERSGLIVRKPYYVPDINELYGLMRQFSYYMPQGARGCRWVMCRETHDAIARQYATVRVAPLSDYRPWRAEADPEPPSLGMAVLGILESHRIWSEKSTLFGMPIRLDPAARSPLFELDSKATR